MVGARAHALARPPAHAHTLLAGREEPRGAARALVRPRFCSSLSVPRHAPRDRVARAVFVRIMRRKDEGLGFGSSGSFGDVGAALERG